MTDSRIGSQTHHIRRAQKEMLLFRELSDLIMRIKYDDRRLEPLILSKVKLSPDRSSCTVFLRIDQPDVDFKELLQILLLYKPSLRTAIAQRIPSRKTPDLLFRYDKQYEKQRRIEELLEKIKDE